MQRPGNHAAQSGVLLVAGAVDHKHVAGADHLGDFVQQGGIIGRQLDGHGAPGKTFARKGDKKRRIVKTEIAEVPDCRRLGSLDGGKFFVGQRDNVGIDDH